MTFDRRILRVRREGVRSLLAATLLIAGCGGGSVSTPVAVPTPTPISVAISPTAASVQTGQAATFRATVANDSAAKGVTWTLAGSGCSGATCGTLSANSSASGAVVTYTAPAAVPGPANVTLSATSVAEGTKSTTATITIAAAPASTIAVTLSQTTATVTVSGTATFIATVANDTQNKGVTWALSGAGCSGAACGALSAPGSASGAAVTYTAPASVPNPAGVTLTATSVTDGTKAAAASIAVTSAPAIAVSVSPTTVSLATGGVTQSFTATVQNDSQNKGVMWALSGSACNGAACGTVSPTLSGTGVAVSYTSPAHAGTVKLTATSVSNNAASAAATIRLTPPSATGPDNLGVGSAPSTVVDSNGVVDIAWITQEGIEFAQSLDNGVTFSTPMLALPLGSLSEQMNIQLDEANDLVIFATFNTNAPTPAAFLARSIDGGKTFASLPVKQNGINPVLLVEPSGALDLAYLDADTNLLHESRSTDGGKTFANDQVLWSPTVPEDSIDIKGVVGAQGQIFLTWVQELTERPTICNIFVVSSRDGKKFSQPLQLDDGAACAVNPTPVVDAAGNFNLAWEANAVFFTRSTDQGQTFAKVAQAATGINVNDQHFSVGPNLEIALIYNRAVVGGAVNQVFFTQSVDHGASFAPPQNLSLPNAVQNFTGAGGGDVAVDSNGRITVAFEDDSEGGFSGDFDVYERTSAGGQTFSDATNLSNTTDQSELLSQILIAAKGIRYFVWYDVSNAQNSNPVVSVFFDAVQ
jgi:hypothetical protein